MPSFSQIIDQNINQYYYYLAKKNCLNLYKGSELSWISNSSLNFLNTIFALPSKASTQIIENIFINILEKKYPAYLLFNDKEVSEDFEKALLLHNFEIASKWSGMTLEIKQLYAATPLPDFEIRLAHSYKELKDWLSIIETGLFRNMEKLEFSFFKNLLNDPKINFYLAYYQKQPATAIMSFNSDDVCGLYLLATLPQYRRMGMADTLMKEAINHGYRQGMKYSTLQATEAGYKIYERMGFKECCEIKFFRFKK